MKKMNRRRKDLSQINNVMMIIIEDDNSTMGRLNLYLRVAPSFIFLHKYKDVYM
jgi:hypothetical protein